MNNKKLIGFTLIGIGVILLIISLLADMISLGSAAGFGWKQIVGALVGAAAVVTGLVLLCRK